MGGFVVEIGGLGAVSAAEELRGLVVREVGEGSVSQVEVERGVDVGAWLSVLFAGVQAAGVVWSWWESRRDRHGVEVTVVSSDGERLRLRSTDRDALVVHITGSELPSGNEEGDQGA